MGRIIRDSRTGSRNDPALEVAATRYSDHVFLVACQLGVLFLEYVPHDPTTCFSAEGGISPKDR